MDSHASRTATRTAPSGPIVDGAVHMEAKAIGAGGHLAQAGAALIWIPQAFLLALAVQDIADGAGVQAVTVPALAFLLLGLLRASLEAWGARRVFADARRFLGTLRAEAAAMLARRSPLDRGRPASGAAASAMAEQAEAVLPWLVRYQGARWKLALVPPVIAVVVAIQSWVAALILLLAAPLIPVFMAVIGWRAKAASEQQLQVMGGMNGFLLDRLRGLSTLRALGAVDLSARRLRDTAQALRTSTMRVLRIAFLSSTALELFAALAVALVAVYVGFHLLGDFPGGAWGSRLGLGEALFILLLAPAFFEPLRELAAAWHDKAAGEAALATLDRLREQGMRMPGALADGGADAQAQRPVRIEIEALRFAHDGEAPLFEDLALSIAPGEHVALVGPSGSGKSTLLALMAGLAAPSGGSVRIDGMALDEEHAATLRARIAWIGQAPHLFPGTVRGNVALGRPGVDGAAAAAALRRSGLGRVRHAVPDARLGEGGAGLSGGELVRLALARAVAAHGTGLLLADEPTAHLDRASASCVIDSLLALSHGRTLVVATHDPVLAARIGRVVHVGRRDAALEAA